jgi:hypothetical protein
MLKSSQTVLKRITWEPAGATVIIQWSALSSFKAGVDMWRIE